MGLPVWVTLGMKLKYTMNGYFFDATANGGVLHFNMSTYDFQKEYNAKLCNVTAYYPNGTSFDVTADYKSSL
jgi:hypothetical protein